MMKQGPYRGSLAPFLVHALPAAVLLVCSLRHNARHTPSNMPVAALALHCPAWQCKCEG
jgi:hypothetical protein